MVSERLKNAIETVKTGGRVISNVYSAELLNKVSSFWGNPNAVLMINNDHGIDRIYYYARQLESIRDLLCNLSVGEYVFEYMTKNPKDYDEELTKMGFERLARMMRMSIRDCSSALINKAVQEYYDEKIGFYPQTSLANEINHTLWNVFDTRVSHLLTSEELKDCISNKEILVHQNEAGKIDAVLQTVCNPRKFYINQIFNGTDKNVIHAMLQKRLKEYTVTGGKYVYAWVEYDNIASVKFHQKYGLQHDGMWNMVYVLKKEIK